jgi:riboflavin kinase / FMN adenylyltransferase
MLHFRSLEDANLPATWLTIGSFDGVHCGHQAIINQLVQDAHAAGALAAVLTFFPHPSAVLGKRQEPFYLTTPDERANLLERLGVDVVVTHPFSLEVAAMTAQEFMALVFRQLHPRHLRVGYDFALGRGREGNVERLQQIGDALGFTLDVIQPVQMEGEIVSSSQIRVALSAGDVTKASRLLGRPYEVSGEIIHGDGRGRLLGIPTANLDIWPQRVLPRVGVYACRAQIDGESWGAVTNVGVRPTFENQAARPQIEAHVLGLNRDLYGEQIRLDFIERLRDEQRFPNVDALVAQIRLDIRKAIERLS